jgi:thymidylate kinase
VRRNKFFVFTGLDGSGTTTLAERLSKTDRGSLLMHTPTPPFQGARPLVDTIVYGESISAHYLFYLASVVHASEKIRTHLTVGNVYCVRYLIDTVVSHRVMGLDVDLAYQTDVYSIIEPDISFFVSVSEETRQRRLASRGKSELDTLLDEEPRRMKFLREFERYGHHLSTISNDKDDPEQAVQAIRAKIESLACVSTS